MHHSQICNVSFSVIVKYSMICTGQLGKNNVNPYKQCVRNLEIIMTKFK